MIWNTNLRWRLPVTCLLLQVALVVLFGVFVRYDLDADPHWIGSQRNENTTSDMENEFYYRYPSKSGHPAGPAEADGQVPHPAQSPACRTCAACCSGTGGGVLEEEKLPAAHWPSPRSLPTRHLPVSGGHP